MLAGSRKYNLHDVPDGDLERLQIKDVHLAGNGKSNGHTHDGIEHLLIFLDGRGIVTLIHDDVHIYQHHVVSGDMVTVKNGWYHHVENTGMSEMRYMVVSNIVDE